MSEETIWCRHCHRAYPLSSVRALQDAPDVDAIAREDAPPISEQGTEWETVRPTPVTEQAGKKWWHRQKDTKTDLDKQADEAERLAGRYLPYCPLGHLMLDALEGTPFVVTVAGNASSSKTTFLLAVALEMIHDNQLGPFSSVRTSLPPAQERRLDEKINNMFVKNIIPTPTPITSVDEGFLIRTSMSSGRKFNLGFFDISGEVIVDEGLVAAHGRFLFSSAGIILLLDPQGFPSENNRYVSSTENIKLVNAGIVHALAEGIERVSGQKLKEQKLPLVVTIAKADLVPLLPPTRLEDYEDIGEGEIFDRLDEESSIVRKYLMDRGMKGVVSAAEDKFGPENVSYAYLSALGQGPDAHDGPFKQQRQPNGCWKPIALILRMRGQFS
jgi:hypothetical protein